MALLLEISLGYCKMPAKVKFFIILIHHNRNGELFEGGAISGPRPFPLLGESVFSCKKDGKLMSVNRLWHRLILHFLRSNGANVLFLQLLQDKRKSAKNHRYSGF